MSRRLSFFCFLGTLALVVCSLGKFVYGQASYPSSLASNITLLQANNNAQTTLTTPLSSVGLTLNVTSAATFILFPTVITIDFEIIKVCSKTPTTLVVCSSGRGWDGTSATLHNTSVVVRGNIIDYYHNQLAAEVIAIETFLGINGANILLPWPSLTLGSNVITFAANSTPTAPLVINNGSVGTTLTTTVPTVSLPIGTGNWWIYQASNGTLSLGLQAGLTATSAGAFTQVVTSQLPVDAVGLWTGHVTIGVFDPITTAANSLQPIAFGGRSFSAGSNVTLTQSGSNVQIAASGGTPGGATGELQLNNGSGGFSSIANSRTTSGSNLELLQGGMTVGNAFNFNWLSQGSIQSPADGVFTLKNNVGNDFGRLQFGGTTASYPSLKRNTTGLDVRLADDSNYGQLSTGATIIYRCTVAGTLRVGQLTSVSADCGTAVDSGLRTQ